MHLQSLKLLCPTVKEEINIQKIHYLTLTLASKSHEILPSTLYIMRLMHLQRLKLPCPTVKEQMHLKERTVFDLGLGTKVRQYVAQ